MLFFLCVSMFVVKNSSLACAACARRDLAPLAMNAYPEAFSHFKQALQACSHPERISKSCLLPACMQSGERAAQLFACSLAGSACYPDTQLRKHGLLDALSSYLCTPISCYLSLPTT